jgi:hypothetical protein
MLKAGMLAGAFYTGDAIASLFLESQGSLRQMGEEMTSIKNAGQSTTGDIKSGSEQTTQSIGSGVMSG